MREIYGCKGLKYAGTVFTSFSTLCAFALLTVVAGLLDAPNLIVTSFFILLYLNGALLLGLLLEGISHELFRLGLVPWMPIFQKFVKPMIMLLGIVVCATHILAINDMGDFGRYLLLIPICLGIILWTVLSWRVWNYSGVIKKNYEMDLERCKDFADNEIHRIECSLKMVLGLDHRIPTAGQRGLVVQGLPLKPWYDPKDFAWTSLFQDRFPEVRNEIIKAIEDPSLPPYFYPGAVVGDWKSLMLIQDGKVLEENRTKCPQVFSLLETIPHYPQFREAQISVLGPNSRIKEHRDTGCHYLTAQFAIVIPEKCGIQVAGETRSWKEGEFLFFNTAFSHGAWNNSESKRVVLIIDFLHPEITDTEARFIKESISC